MQNILFLDDMKWRHTEFRRVIDEFYPDMDVTYVWNASDAIEALKTKTFVQVFLDHDLSEDDIMMVVGQEGTVPSGMTVVDFICEMEKPPSTACIHSCNGPAAVEMELRLERHPAGIFCQRVAFPSLIPLMEQSAMRKQ